MSVYKIKKVSIDDASSDEIIFTRIMDMLEDIVNDRIKHRLQNPEISMEKSITMARRDIRWEAEAFNKLVDLFGEREYDDDMDE